MELVERFSLNERGRDLIVGDIHGHFTRLQVRLDAIGFDPSAGDRLFSVGDLVDRGPESDEALDWIARPWFHPVQGNHDDFAIRWPKGNMQAEHYIRNGGSWNVFNTVERQLEIADALATLPVAIELETHAGLVGIVHADCPTRCWEYFVQTLKDPDVSNGEKRGMKDRAQWSRSRVEFHEQGLGTTPVDGVRAVVVGHTPLKNPVWINNVLHIDTGGWSDYGRFTIIDAGTLEEAK